MRELLVLLGMILGVEAILIVQALAALLATVCRQP